MDTEINKIITEYKQGSDEPLDGDEVDKLAYIVRVKMDLHEGNITEKEYDNLLDEISF